MRTIGLLAVVTAGLGALVGCGRCEGAIRAMDTLEPTVDAEATFLLQADGPGGVTSEELLTDAAVGPDSWYLLDAAGEAVPAGYSADWGGHNCLNGNMFFLVPDEPLLPGDYSLVLELERIDWPWLGDDPVVFEGREAVLRAYTVP